MFFRLLCVVALVAVVCIAGQSHHSEWGRRQFNDSLVFRQFVRKESKLWRIVSEEMYYPNKTQQYFPNQTITYIRAIDQVTNGSGGYASLRYGGVGYSAVGIRLKSQRNNGLNFIVEIYSRFNNSRATGINGVDGPYYKWTNTVYVPYY